MRKSKREALQLATTEVEVETADLDDVEVSIESLEDAEV